MLTFFTPELTGRPFTSEEIKQLNKITENMFKCKCGANLPRPYHDTLCWACQRELEREKKRKWLVDRKYTKTIEERISELEEWMYEHSTNHPKSIGDILFR